MKQAFRLTVVIVFTMFYWHNTYAESPRMQLKQMVEQLQANPSDDALRTQIIQLANKLKPAPAIPEEARMHFVKAVTLQKDAKNPRDYDLPIQEYQQALLLAPWWSDAYYDLASALELTQQYPEAIQNLKLSILANQNGQDTRAAQDKIYALEAEQEKLVKDKAEQEQAARSEAAKYGWLLGQWKVHYRFYGGDNSNRTQWDVSSQASKSGNQVLFAYSSDKVGTAPNGEPMSVPFDPNAQPFLRATIGESGTMDWQYDFGTAPIQCPTQIGLQNINVVVSSDQRTLTITLPSMSVYSEGGCTPSGYFNEYILTRE